MSKTRPTKVLLGVFKTFWSARRKRKRQKRRKRICDRYGHVPGRPSNICANCGFPVDGGRVPPLT